MRQALTRGFSRYKEGEASAGHPAGGRWQGADVSIGPGKCWQICHSMAPDPWLVVAIGVTSQGQAGKLCI